MIWYVPPKDQKVKRRFALLPKKIGDYRVWLGYYYETFDFTMLGYSSRFFLHKEDAQKHIEENNKKYGK